MSLDVDRLIYTILDIYHSILVSTKDVKGIKKLYYNHKSKKHMRDLNDIIDNLPYSNIILSTNSLIEFVSFILYTSELTSFGSILNIIVKSASNTRNIYLLTIISGDYVYNVKLDLDNENMNIDIKLSEPSGEVTANTKLVKLVSNDPNKNSFVSKAIDNLNRELLFDISKYLRAYIDKGD